MWRAAQKALLAAMSVVVCGASTFGADDGAQPPGNPLNGTELTAQEQAAVDKGLEALARRQESDGSFGTSMGRHVGISSLCAMAFMQAGNLPGRGKYGAVVDKTVNFIVNSAQESGLICADSLSPPMYGHGFATLFLGEVYGMTGDERVKEKLQKAVKLIEQSQNDQGGWRYQPAPVDADISVTICQVMALRGARDAGIKVEKQTIDHAIAYVRRCQNSDGGFSYQLNQGGFGGGSGFARTGAGIASLFYAGVYEGKEISKGLEYLRRFMPGKNRADTEGNFYYGQYYAVQAMFLSGGQDWATWYPAIREELLRRQNKATGLWSGDVSDEYATAMALLILQMPNRYLPVYSGKGPGS
ncbi:MAG: prenyltransferase/squalene oxidase repeat-containing protein [Tepidisphaeraceae bacterium]